MHTSEMVKIQGRNNFFIQKITSLVILLINSSTEQAKLILIVINYMCTQYYSLLCNYHVVTSVNWYLTM